VQHPQQSSDIVLSDFYLFRPFKNVLSGKRFEHQNALQKTVVWYFTFFGKEHYREGMLQFVK
jgi:hypothetical protein